MKHQRWAFAIWLLVGTLAGATLVTVHIIRVGKQADGRFLLNSGWKLSPAGTMLPLDTLPMSLVITGDQQHAIVLNAGFNEPTLKLVSLVHGEVEQTLPLGDAWLGLTAVSADTFLVSGGSRADLAEVRLQDGRLKIARRYSIIAPEESFRGHFTGDIALSKDGETIYAADLIGGRIAVIDRKTGVLRKVLPTGQHPYRLLLDQRRGSLFVTAWADAKLVEYDLATGQLRSELAVDDHPTDIAAVQHEGDSWLLVTAGNTNFVDVVDLKDPAPHIRERINVALRPSLPVGATPSAVTISSDQKTAFVACSDSNMISVVRLGEESHIEGVIPTGWYPTAVKQLKSGGLLVLNGKGAGSHPNPNGLNPYKDVAPPVNPEGIEYPLKIQKGSIEFISSWTLQQLHEYTTQTLNNSPFGNVPQDVQPTANPGFPIPKQKGQVSPIKHVLFIMKENRTYDQVFGDINGDLSLNIFGEKITPNLHALAKEFTLFDNFYVNADVSMDGHEWSTGAIATDYTQKMVPNLYADRIGIDNGGHVRNEPAAGRIWQAVAKAGLSVRNYGYLVSNTGHHSSLNIMEDVQTTPPPLKGRQVEKAPDPVLGPVTDMDFRGYDFGYPDRARANAFVTDLHGMEQSDSMPNFMFMILANDHTQATRPDALTPSAMVADNDQAVGMVVDAVSHSKFWAETCILILEDDAQDGADHIDSHRSPALVISPYTRRRFVDHGFYNTTSLLKTIEAILGLEPLTQFDAGSQPMWTAFKAQPDLTPFLAQRAQTSLTDRNPHRGALAVRASKLDLDDPDMANEAEFNDLIWMAMRGTPAPPPTRSLFSYLQ